MIEQDELEETLSYRANVTGISHTVFISPRVKVAIDPPDSLDLRGTIATVTLDGTATDQLRQRLQSI
ncbi:hypothetical protein ABIF78_007693 [Bradyrhizobium japonicum]